MKLLVVVFAAVAIAAVAAGPQQYTSKYDNINLDDILKSERLLANYVNCLLDKGNCTPDGKELKAVLPDAIETGCEKCSDKQKAGAEKMIRHLVNNKPEQWKELADKYDPENKYRVKWESRAKDLGITV